MRRRIFQLLLLLSLFLLVGCGRATTENAPSPTVPASSSPKETPSATPTPQPFPQLSIYSSLEDGSVVALNSTDGSVRWHTSLGATAQVSVGALTTDLVYAVAITRSSDDTTATSVFSALNARDGATRWQHELSGVGQIQQLVTGVLYATISDSNNSSAHLDEVLAYNAADGQLLWSTPIKVSNNFGLSMTASLVEQGTLYLSWAGPVAATPGVSYVYALTTSTGAILWHFTAPKPAATVVAVANGQVFVSEDFVDGPSAPDVLAVNASDGSVRWQAGGDFVGVENDQVYLQIVEGTFPNFTLSYAGLSTSTGTVRWRLQADLQIEARPVIANGVLYLLGVTGVISAHRGQDGVALWQQQTGTGTNLTILLLVSTDVVYVAVQEQGLYALSAQDGTVKWLSQAERDVTISAVVNGGIFGETSTSKVIALNTSDGALRWEYDPGMRIITALVG